MGELVVWTKHNQGKMQLTLYEGFSMSYSIKITWAHTNVFNKWGSFSSIKVIRAYNNPFNQAGSSSGRMFKMGIGNENSYFQKRFSISIFPL